LKENLQIGKLYKIEWLGTTIDTSINEKKFRFISKGFLKPTITILNLSTNAIVGTIKIKHLLNFQQNDVLTPPGAEMQHRKVRWRFCAFVIPLPRLCPGGVFTNLHLVT